jgi:hypothetical protein
VNESLKFVALVFWSLAALLGVYSFEVYILEPRGMGFSLVSGYGAAGLGIPFVYGLWLTMAFIDERYS